MITHHFSRGILAIAMSTGFIAPLQASETPAKQPEFVLSYGVGQKLELETRLKQMETDRNARIAAGINNRYQAGLGMNWKPSKRFKLGPRLGYRWSERYGTYDSRLSRQTLQFSFDAVFRF